MMSKLTLLVEGGPAKALYFVQNGVFPAVLGFKIEDFIPKIKFLTKEDDILVVINGLTDFRPSEVYALIMQFERQVDYLLEKGVPEEELPQLTIASNVNLGTMRQEYFLYKGDLFYGEVKRVEYGRMSDVVTGEEASAKRKRVKQNEESKENFSLNGLMLRYAKYNQDAVNVSILGNPVVTERPKQESREYLASVALEKRVVQVNRFPK